MDQAPELIAAMMGLHDGLAERFFAHQRALLDRDFAAAAGLLRQYRSELFAHAEDEERLVLPRYEQLGGDPDAPVRLFLGEHKNLRAFVDEFVQRTAALCEQPEDRALLALLDRQATFKNLVLHHDLRERNVLYPFLQARLAVAEQEAILAGRSWRGDNR
jgi:hemerythrin-like domain-containing protein